MHALPCVEGERLEAPLPLTFALGHTGQNHDDSIINKLYLQRTALRDHYHLVLIQGRRKILLLRRQFYGRRRQSLLQNEVLGIWKGRLSPRGDAVGRGAAVQSAVRGRRAAHPRLPPRKRRRPRVRDRGRRRVQPGLPVHAQDAKPSGGRHRGGQTGDWVSQIPLVAS